jgi:hypothetical protein
MTSGSGREAGSGKLPGWLPWSIVVVVLIAAGSLWLARDRLLGTDATVEQIPGVQADSAAIESAEQPDPEAAASTAAGMRWEEVLGRVPDWPDDLARPGDCDEIDRDLDRTCRFLAPLSGAGEDATLLCAELRAALSDLAENRPAASGEASRPDLLLANVVHVARILGPDRALFWGELAAKSADHAEPLAFVLYRYGASRPSCDPDHPLADEGAARDYAVFVLDTVGGSAYLARRMPAQASLARFYALVAVSGVEEGRRGGGHGFDPRPHIRRNLAALDDEPLLMRDRYLEALRQMERRWSRP